MFTAPGFPAEFVIAALVKRLGGNVTITGEEIIEASDKADLGVAKQPGRDAITLVFVGRG